MLDAEEGALRDVGGRQLGMDVEAGARGPVAAPADHDRLRDERRAGHHHLDHGRWGHGRVAYDERVVLFHDLDDRVGAAALES